MKKNDIGFNILKPPLALIFKGYYKPTIINSEVIPKDGPILIVGNHKHLFDQCLPIISTKRTVHYLAKKEYFDSWKTRWFFKFAGCIPVDRSKKDDSAKNSALEILEQGGAIGIFPEGTRNKTQEFLLPFKFGAVSLAKKTDATLVPFGITGEYERKNNLTVTFGTPFKVEDMSLEEANEKLRNEIGNVMKKSLKKSSFK